MAQPFPASQMIPPSNTPPPPPALPSTTDRVAAFNKHCKRIKRQDNVSKQTRDEDERRRKQIEETPTKFPMRYSGGNLTAPEIQSGLLAHNNFRQYTNQFLVEYLFGEELPVPFVAEILMELLQTGIIEVEKIPVVQGGSTTTTPDDWVDACTDAATCLLATLWLDAKEVSKERYRWGWGPGLATRGEAKTAYFFNTSAILGHAFASRIDTSFSTKFPIQSLFTPLDQPNSPLPGAHQQDARPDFSQLPVFFFHSSEVVNGKKLFDTFPTPQTHSPRHFLDKRINSSRATPRPTGLDVTPQTSGAPDATHQPESERLVDIAQPVDPRPDCPINAPQRAAPDITSEPNVPSPPPPNPTGRPQHHADALKAIRTRVAHRYRYPVDASQLDIPDYRYVDPCAIHWGNLQVVGEGKLSPQGELINQTMRYLDVCVNTQPHRAIAIGMAVHPGGVILVMATAHGTFQVELSMTSGRGVIDILRMSIGLAIARLDFADIPGFLSQVGPFKEAEMAAYFPMRDPPSAPATDTPSPATSTSAPGAQHSETGATKRKLSDPPPSSQSPSPSSKHPEAKRARHEASQGSDVGASSTGSVDHGPTTSQPPPPVPEVEKPEKLYSRRFVAFQTETDFFYLRRPIYYRGTTGGSMTVVWDTDRDVTAFPYIVHEDDIKAATRARDGGLRVCDGPWALKIHNVNLSSRSYRNRVVEGISELALRHEELGKLLLLPEKTWEIDDISSRLGRTNLGSTEAPVFQKVASLFVYKDTWDSGPLSIEKIHAATDQLKAVHLLREHNYNHRDIHPLNMFFAQDNSQVFSQPGFVAELAVPTGTPDRQIFVSRRRPDQGRSGVVGAIGDFHSASKSGDTTNEVNTDPANFMTGDPAYLPLAVLSGNYRKFGLRPSDIVEPIFYAVFLGPWRFRDLVQASDSQKTKPAKWSDDIRNWVAPPLWPNAYETAFVAKRKFFRRERKWLDNALEDKKHAEISKLLSDNPAVGKYWRAWIEKVHDSLWTFNPSAGVTDDAWIENQNLSIDDLLKELQKLMKEFPASSGEPTTPIQ